MKLSDKAKAALDKAIARFESGDLSPITMVLSMNLPEDAPARKWTLTNRIMACAQSHTSDNRGYRQWQEAGRNVRKGARAAFILYPRTIKKESPDGEEKVQLIGFGTTAVFGVDDTEGDEIPEYTPRKLPPLLEVAERMGVEVKYAPMIGALGYCSGDGKKIRLATDDEATFFHELAHAAHDTFFTKQAKGQDPHAETVAELTACILMDLCGLRDTTGNAWQYIKHYNEDPLKAIMKALADVEKVLGVLFPEPAAI